MTNTERLLSHIFHIDRPDVEAWRPGKTVTPVPPTAAFIANRAIKGMMR